MCFAIVFSCAHGGLQSPVCVYLQQRMWKSAIKAFQNLQLTEHHIDSLQQSAAGASGDERRRGRCERSGAGQLARRRAPLLRHRPSDIPGPDHWPDGLLVPVRVPQLSEARVRSALVYVQRAILGRRRSHRCWYGCLLPSPCC